MAMLIEKLQLQNILSFKDTTVELRPMNLLIGPNGSGKSNLLAVIGLLQAAPRDLQECIRKGGGFEKWRWLGGASEHGLGVGADLAAIPARPGAKYRLELTFSEKAMQVTHESLSFLRTDGTVDPLLGFELDRTLDRFEFRAERTQVETGNICDRIPSGESVLRVRRDSEAYPEITSVGRDFEGIRKYEDWRFGSHAPVRQAQSSDYDPSPLRPNCENLVHVLARFRTENVLEQVEEAMARFLRPFEAIHIMNYGEMLYIELAERGLKKNVPAVRLSDGTLRFLCLAVILLDPQPAPLICIEEPELGMHPDVMPLIADMLKEASERTQLIVTTHSDALVDEFGDQPDAVVVCEKWEEGTQFERLEPKQLKRWLRRYELGELWRKGELGGTRW